MHPQSFQQRLQDIEDSISKIQALLKDFEDALLYEINPKIKAGYRREIENLRESIADYRQEYKQLQQEMKNLISSQTQEVGNQQQQMQKRLNLLHNRQKETYQNLSRMRQDWLNSIDEDESTSTSEDSHPESQEQNKEPLADYTHLQDLLAAEEWKEADMETARVMLELAGRQTNGWLRAKDIDALPCPDLKYIDKLWAEYSNSRFGFSLQQQIWSQVGGQQGKFNGNIFYKFCDRVGWRKNNEWLKNEELEFTVDAPEGHLPSLFFTNPNDPGGWFGLRKDSFNHFLPHLSVCLSR